MAVSHVKVCDKAVTRESRALTMESDTSWRENEGRKPSRSARTSMQEMLRVRVSSLRSPDNFFSSSELIHMISSPRARTSVHAVESLPIPALRIRPAWKMFCAATRAPSA